MAKEILNQTYGTSIVDSQGKPTVEFFNLISQLVNLEIIEGTGSPELVVDATRKSRYWDSVTNDFYFKTTNQGTLNASGEPTGWILE